MYIRARGSGYPVLFLHGIPTSGDLWTPMVDRMSEQFRCLIADLPGFGRSECISRGAWDLPGIAASLDEVRRQHGIDRWHIAAHDGGCAIAIHYAHLFPRCVGRLALLTPSMFPELKPFCLCEVLRKPLVGELLAPAVHVLFWNVAMRVALQDSHELDGAVVRFRSPFRGFKGPWRLMSRLRWGDPAALLASVPALLPGISAPAAVFHGRRDPAVPVDFACRTAKLLPQSQLHLLDAGHFLPLLEAPAISEFLLQFFTYDERPALQSTAIAT